MHRNSTMNTVRLHSGGRLGVAALLLTALTACSGHQKAAPPATAAPSPSADAAIPPTASPYDTLPESVAGDGPAHQRGLRRDGQTARDSRRRDVQPHALLHRQGAGAQA